jgi:hypothetical protein
VARDGAVLLDIARKLLPTLGLQIECRYLYGSRQAWHRSSIIGQISLEGEYVAKPVSLATLPLIARLRTGRSDWNPIWPAVRRFGDGWC